MPKLRKRAIHILSLFKKRGFIPGGAEKGGIRAHIGTMSNIGSYPRECRKGRSKDLDPHMQNCNLGLF